MALRRQLSDLMLVLDSTVMIPPDAARKLEQHTKFLTSASGRVGDAIREIRGMK